MKIYYVCTDPITPVVESQVLDNIRMLGQSEIDVALILLLQKSHYRWQKNLIKDKYGSEGFQLFTRPVPMQHGLIGFCLAFFHLSSILLFNRSQNTILHCRGIRATNFANAIKRFFRNVKVIFDCRGDVIAEMEFGGRSEPLIDLYRKYESQNLKNSDYTLFVSRYLRKTVRKRNPSLEYKSDIIYCSANKDKVKFVKEKRNKTRSLLNISDEIVFVYSGSIGRWHCFDQIIRLCELLKTQYSDAKFLILTNQLDPAKEQIEASEISDSTIVLSVEAGKVGDYLSSSDVAMIVRESHPLNYSSSPVKVAEFIINGLPLLISDSIKDYSQIIEKSGRGLVLRSGPIVSSGLEEELGSLSKSDWLNLRNSYPEDITEILTKDSTVKKLASIYKQLCMPIK